MSFFVSSPPFVTATNEDTDTNAVAKPMLRDRVGDRRQRLVTALVTMADANAVTKPMLRDQKREEGGLEVLFL